MFLKPKPGQGIDVTNNVNEQPFPKIVNIKKINCVKSSEKENDSVVSVDLQDDTIILAPDPQTKIISRVKINDNTHQYLEARCYGQNNYQSWADLFI